MAVKQLSDGNPEGTCLGQNSSDLVGFHGKVAVQAATIATIATTTSLTAALFSAVVNALIGKGIIASS